MYIINNSTLDLAAKDLVEDLEIYAQDFMERSQLFLHAPNRKSHFPSDNPQSTLIEYRDRILMREQQILQHLQKVPCTIHQLAEQHIIYRKHPTSFVLFWEKAMLKNHLQRLLNLELIELVEDGHYRSRKAV